MKLSTLLLLAAIVPNMCAAQKWRLEFNAGAVVSSDLRPEKDIEPISRLYRTNAPPTIPSDRGVLHAIGGLKLMRCDSAIEYGISINAFPIHFQDVTAKDTGGGLFTIDHQAYLAKPAIPVRAFINYNHHRSQRYGYIGANAGVVIARGKDMQNANELSYYDNFKIYFHNAVGYTFGGQLGYRRAWKQIDIGGELSANFIHLSLNQGTSRASYKYNLLYFPLQLYIGYSF